jgi:GTP-binding protein YchF
MSLQCGIVGLPNVGKSTLFNALTAAGAEAQNYPFCTIEPNIGVVSLQDPRLDKIAELIKPKQVIPTAVEFLDIAGLVKGASEGEGLGNQFLGQIRNVDAIVEVVRCFEDPDVVHVHGEFDPLRDIEVIHTELALADLESVNKRLDKLHKAVKSGDPEAIKQQQYFDKIRVALDAGEAVRTVEAHEEERAWLKEACLLTAKPMLYAANVGEADVANEDHPAVKVLREHAAKEDAEVVVISAKIESELASLEEAERADFLQELGLSASGIERLATKAYRLLGLRTFFTAGEKEVRAWTIHAGSHAPQAAGVIHSDFEKHFIRAEVYHYEDLVALGSEHAVKEAGKLRIEGKDYEVQDGDIIFFRTSA